MNLYVYGSRKITVQSTGEEDIQKTYFNLWQTPTHATRTILKSPDIKKAYIEWLNRLNIEPTDITDPVTYEIINEVKDLIKKLNDWVEYCEKNGYKLEWFEM